MAPTEPERGRDFLPCVVPKDVYFPTWNTEG
jgi:hypothetical protein